MNRKPDRPLSDDELHALVDGQGPLDDLAALQMRLADDPDAQARLAQWQRQRDALQRLHAQVLSEAVPANLLQAAQAGDAVRTSSNHWRRYGGMAAGVVMAFGAGWLANANWQQVGGREATAPSMASAQPEREFVRQAVLAHAVYAPEIRHPVEVSAQEQKHLVQWLSKRLEKPLKVPDLTAQGFDLVGGRLLPGEAGARAQFMFQDATGQRVTLYLGAMESVAAGVSGKETRFRFESQAAIPSFYWVDQGFGYALAGQLPHASLMQLAQEIYRQL
ncbi:MAG: anti-sigma factor [Rhodoferax sp.]|uniref:anti-sigma factor family protein n=1 Tax=Rhodoferax sp. TaxID=50421 RepID=UPI002733B72F|nr:anti-sigma factor [Rhodoferax sp.]MDP2678173.1 anti-sigma factor [Rhodoferax sp.]